MKEGYERKGLARIVENQTISRDRFLTLFEMTKGGSTIARTLAGAAHTARS
jgi:hypothetical protein